MTDLAKMIFDEAEHKTYSKKPFDMSALGFERIPDRSSGGTRLENVDYLAFNHSTKTGETAVLNLCVSTCEYIQSNYGDTVGVGIDSVTGNIIVAAGNDRKIHHCSHKHAVVSMGAWTTRLRSYAGNAKKYALRVVHESYMGESYLRFIIEGEL